MNQPTRKRQHQQSPPRVKEEPQEQEEGTNSIGAGINCNASQCSSSNLEDSNTIDTAAGGNGDDYMSQLILKMANLETRNHLMEGKLANQELNARIREEAILTNLKQEDTALMTKLKEVEKNAKTDCKKIMETFGQRLTALEAKHQQEISGLKAIIERGQLQQQQTTTMSNCVIVDMPESQGTSNNSNEIQYIPSIMVPCHSANLPDCVNMQESHSHGYEYGMRRFESRHRQQTTLGAVAALIPSPPPPPPPPPSPALNPVQCHSAEQEEAKRLCNPAENGWNSNTCKTTLKITKPDELSVHNSSPVDWGNLIARKPFSVFAHHSPQQNAGTILYYYEITTASPLLFNEGRLRIGFSHHAIKTGSWVGSAPNTYAMQDDKHYLCIISGKCLFFEWPAGTIKPILYGCWDVFGCGLVLSPDEKLAIFFTTNGVLMGKQFPIVHTASAVLYPCVQLNRNVTVEANFGQKPFKYNIDECPGLQLQW